MDPELGGFLDPAAVARLGSLEVAARSLVEGFLKGIHLSSRKGSSAEFAEHRPYVPGDETRRIDWRTFGKTDRFYLKEYDDETNLRAVLVLDASGSMAFGSRGLAKSRYAALTAAALGYLLLGQRDAIGLAVAGEGPIRYLPPKATAQHLAGLLTAMEGLAPRGAANVAGAIHEVAGRLRARSLAIVLSDFLEDPAAVLRSVAHLKHRGSEALLFHVLDPAEEEFPFTGWTVFQDSEDRASRLRLDARQVRELYLANLNEHLRILRTGAAALGAEHVVLRTRAPFETALAAYLSARARRRR